MDFTTLSTDEYLDLDQADHTAAIALYECEVSRLNLEASMLIAGTPEANDLFDKMCSYLTIRKVHAGRLEELQAEAAATPTTGSSMPIAQAA